MAASAQGLIKGRVLDKSNNEPLSFVNVKIANQGSDALVKGAVTDIEGHFSIDGLKNGQYTLTLTFVGYRNVVRNFVINDRNRSHNFPALYMTEDAHQLKEVTVTGQRSAMKLDCRW